MWKASEEEQSRRGIKARLVTAARLAAELVRAKRKVTWFQKKEKGVKPFNKWPPAMVNFN